MVGLFIPYSNLVSEAPCSPLPSPPAPGHCRSWGSRGPSWEVAWGRVWAACMEMKLSYVRDICSSKPAKGTTASHSFIRGLTANGCPRRALTWIQLVADPIDAPLHKLIDYCHAISVAHLLHHIPGSVPALLITSTTGFSFQVNVIKRIHLAHFAQKGRLLNGSFYLLCIPGL